MIDLEKLRLFFTYADQNNYNAFQLQFENLDPKHKIYALSTNSGSPNRYPLIQHILDAFTSDQLLTIIEKIPTFTDEPPSQRDTVFRFVHQAVNSYEGSKNEKACKVLTALFIKTPFDIGVKLASSLYSLYVDTLQDKELLSSQVFLMVLENQGPDALNQLLIRFSNEQQNKDALQSILLAGYEGSPLYKHLCARAGKHIQAIIEIIYSKVQERVELLIEIEESVEPSFLLKILNSEPDEIKKRVLLSAKKNGTQLFESMLKNDPEVLKDFLNKIKSGFDFANKNVIFPSIAAQITDPVISHQIAEMLDCFLEPDQISLLEICIQKKCSKAFLTLFEKMPPSMRADVLSKKDAFIFKACHQAFQPNEMLTIINLLPEAQYKQNSLIFFDDSTEIDRKAIEPQTEALFVLVKVSFIEFSKNKTALFALFSKIDHAISIQMPENFFQAYIDYMDDERLLAFMKSDIFFEPASLAILNQWDDSSVLEKILVRLEKNHQSALQDILTTNFNSRPLYQSLIEKSGDHIPLVIRVVRPLAINKESLLLETLLVYRKKMVDQIMDLKAFDHELYKPQLDKKTAIFRDIDALILEICRHYSPSLSDKLLEEVLLSTLTFDSSDKFLTLISVIDPAISIRLLFKQKDKGEYTSLFMNCFVEFSEDQMVKLTQVVNDVTVEGVNNELTLLQKIQESENSRGKKIRNALLLKIALSDAINLSTDLFTAYMRLLEQSKLRDALVSHAVSIPVPLVILQKHGPKGLNNFLLCFEKPQANNLITTLSKPHDGKPLYQHLIAIQGEHLATVIGILFTDNLPADADQLLKILLSACPSKELVDGNQQTILQIFSSLSVDNKMKIITEYQKHLTPLILANMFHIIPADDRKNILYQKMDSGIFYYEYLLSGKEKTLIFFLNWMKFKVNTDLVDKIFISLKNNIRWKNVIETAIPVLKHFQIPDLIALLDTCISTPIFEDRDGQGIVFAILDCFDAITLNEVLSRNGPEEKPRFIYFMSALNFDIAMFKEKYSEKLNPEMRGKMKTGIEDDLVLKVLLAEIQGNIDSNDQDKLQQSLNRFIENQQSDPQNHIYLLNMALIKLSIPARKQVLSAHYDKLPMKVIESAIKSMSRDDLNATLNMQTAQESPLYQSLTSKNDFNVQFFLQKFQKDLSGDILKYYQTFNKSNQASKNNEQANPKKALLPELNNYFIKTFSRNQMLLDSLQSACNGRSTEQEVMMQVCNSVLGCSEKLDELILSIAPHISEDVVSFLIRSFYSNLRLDTVTKLLCSMTRVTLYNTLMTSSPENPSEIRIIEKIAVDCKNETLPFIQVMSKLKTSQSDVTIYMHEVAYGTKTLYSSNTATNLTGKTVASVVGYLPLFGGAAKNYVKSYQTETPIYECYLAQLVRSNPVLMQSLHILLKDLTSDQCTVLLQRPDQSKKSLLIYLFKGTAELDNLLNILVKLNYYTVNNCKPFDPSVLDVKSLRSDFVQHPFKSAYTGLIFFLTLYNYICVRSKEGRDTNFNDSLNDIESMLRHLTINKDHPQLNEILKKYCDTNPLRKAYSIPVVTHTIELGTNRHKDARDKLLELTTQELSLGLNYFHLFLEKRAALNNQTDGVAIDTALIRSMTPENAMSFSVL